MILSLFSSIFRKAAWISSFFWMNKSLFYMQGLSKLLYFLVRIIPLIHDSNQIFLQLGAFNLNGYCLWSSHYNILLCIQIISCDTQWLPKDQMETSKGGNYAHPLV